MVPNLRLNASRYGLLAVVTLLAGPALAQQEARGPAVRATTHAILGYEACCTLTVGRTLFESYCVPCHGNRGKGDGPAAAALNPRPADLTDSTRMKPITDDSMAVVIKKGSKVMPAFGTMLNAEQVKELVFYVHSLKP